MSDESDRRKDARHATAAKVNWGESEEIRSQKLRDISSRGMFVVCDSPPEVMTNVDFELSDETGEVLLRGHGRVVWVQPESGMGIEFVELQLGETDLDRLGARPDEDDADRPSVAKIQARGGTAKVATMTIGIDLGTSNTCASIVKDGKALVIPTRYGTNTIPSVLTVDEDGGTLVGDAAAKRMLLNPERCAYGTKRLIGRVYREDVAEEYQPFFAYPIVQAETGRFGADLGGRVFSMEEVARHLLSEVRHIARVYLNAKVEQAVITVPAYFAEVQRDAVRSAGRAAGLSEVRIVTEPTAAAVTFGYRRNMQARIVVFDLGGGTFDISVLDIERNEFVVIATGGDCFLGGIDFDDFIASHLLEEFGRAERVEMTPTPQQLIRLRTVAEQAKQGLSVQSKFAVHLPQFAQVKGQWRDLQTSITREQVDQLAAPLLDRMMQITEMVLAASDIETSSIDDVLLIGGMTRMPAVADRVEAFFLRKPSRRVNPDEAVALGAALVAKQHDEGGEGVRLVDVLPLSIGMAGAGRRFMRLVSQQTRVPTERTFLIKTNRLDQSTYELPIFQGERPDAADNEYLGTAIIANIPPGPPGSQSYELALSLDRESVLSVTAREEKSGARVPVELDRDRSIQEVVAALGPYEGEGAKKEPAPRPVSRLGQLFATIRGFLGG